MKKVFIAGGGTGGHFYPAVSVATELINNGYQVIYFGTKKGIESKKDFPASQKHLFDIEGVRGRNPRKAVKSALKLLKTSLFIRSLIKKEKPDFVLCFGGYSSLPLGLAAAGKVPLFLHEQNSIPSYTNKLLSLFAKKIFITFEVSKKYFPEKKTVLTGLPLRQELLEDLKIPQNRARDIINIPDKKTVLVFGGSQGSRVISENAIKLAQNRKDLQFILIGGKNFKKPENLPDNIKYFDFYDRMGILYSASDIIIARSGAASTYEILAAGKPAVFIPYPYAASDHQYYNVKWLEEKGLCHIIRENQLTLETLQEKINDLLSKNIQKEIKSLYISNSAKKILKEIFNELDRV